MTTLRLQPDLEDTLRTLPDIRGASVVTSGDGAPVEVHVLARSGKPAKQIVRDIQSVAMVQHNIDLDHRIVSIVQLGDADDPGDEDDPGAPRVAVSAVTVSTAGQTISAAVRLESSGVRYEGVAEGMVAPQVRARVLAQATLAATADLLGMSAEVEQAAVIELGDRKVALVAVQLLTQTGPLVVTGSALVRVDDADAVARAVLDALNRRLSG